MDASEDKRVVLWGGTGHARVLSDCLDVLGYSVIAVFDRQAVSPPFRGVPTYMGEAAFAEWRKSRAKEKFRFAVAIGGQHGGDRLERADWLVRHGLEPITIIHAAAVIEPSANIECGAQILAGAIVGAAVRVGPQVIINTGASVDHDCHIGAGVHIAPGAVLCGEVQVADRAFIGAGATVLPRIRVGKGAVVAAGATVVRDVVKGQSVAGVPAREFNKS